ncbi:unnamed protein product [Rotaria magnacalcarata]|uniref:Uncharacterized protein n=1 Tax=Rotaria magnacalcarata TaxID=392030 RepID=A0A816S5M6_9BILA|nr:unnamed protein product [Rotaria magnacalcarata]CAF4229782.1 unnamed protein product [Rotaria magnacalcarata]
MANDIKKQKFELERCVNISDDLYKLMREKTKENVCYLCEHLHNLKHDEKLVVEFDSFVKQLDDDICRPYSNKPIHKINIEINELRKQVQFAIKEFKYIINENLSHSQIEAFVSTLMETVDTVFNQIISLFEAVNEEVSGVKKELVLHKDEIYILKRNLVMNNCHLLIRELFSNAEALLFELFQTVKLPTIHIKDTH